MSAKLVDAAALAEMFAVSESTIDRLVREGLPTYDLTPRGDGKRRPRQRLLRFDPTAVLDWLRERREARP